MKMSEAKTAIEPLKRVRLTRSLLLHERHAEAGSIQDLAQPLADDLIAQGSAVQLNVVSRFLHGFSSTAEPKEKKGTE